MEQGTDEWRESRMGFFSSSEIHKLLVKGKSSDFGDTATTYILDKLGEKISGKPIESQDNKATLWGKEQEPLARDWYCRLHGMVCDEVGFIKHPMIENFGGSPDGIIYKVGSGDEAGILEIKSPYNYSNHLNHLLIEDTEYFKKYYKEYYWQITANCLINGLDWAHFVSFDPRMTKQMGLFVMKIEPSADDASFLVERIELANKEMKRIADKLKIRFM